MLLLLRHKVIGTSRHGGHGVHRDLSGLRSLMSLEVCLSLGVEQVGGRSWDLSRELLLLLPWVDRAIDWLLLLWWRDRDLLRLCLGLERKHVVGRGSLHHVDIAKVDGGVGGRVDRHAKGKQRFELLGEQLMLSFGLFRELFIVEISLKMVTAECFRRVEVGGGLVVDFRV